MTKFATDRRTGFEDVLFDTKGTYFRLSTIQKIFEKLWMAIFPNSVVDQTLTALNLQNYLKNIAEKSDRFLTFQLKRIGFLKVSWSEDANTTYL